MDARPLELDAGPHRVHHVGALDPQRKLFDALIPLPHGTSYNAWLVQGSEAAALVDTVEPDHLPALRSQLRSLGDPDIRYVVSNHAEQDHSGSLGPILEAWPRAELLTSPRGRKMLLTHLDLPEDRIRTVDDGETVSLGDRTLEFLHAPWVHWPETMFTWLREDRVLFSCDLFGSHIGTEQLLAHREPAVESEARRYYATIMMPFATHVRKHLARLENYDIQAIAPSHGPAWLPPEPILERYRTWSEAEPANQVVIAYVSMHGSTREMARQLEQRLLRHEIEVRSFDLTATDEGELAAALIHAPTLLLGSPTVLAEPHPRALALAGLVHILKPRLQHIGIFGSFGWGSKIDRRLHDLMSRVKAEPLDAVLARGLPRPDTTDRLDALADAVNDRHAALFTP